MNLRKFVPAESQKKALKHLNEGLLYTNGALDLSRPEVLELFEDTQIRLADLKSGDVQ